MMNYLIKVWLVVLTFGFLVSCQEQTVKTESLPDIPKTAINLDHFYHLYKEISIEGDTMGIVHIYSEFPDYEYEIEPREGYTCVDDVARATVMLTEYIHAGYGDENTRRQIKKMVKFMLHMQNENGYFNNFIWHDLSINTTYQTTVAELNWWSLRAFWALEEAYPLLEHDDVLSERIEMALDKLVDNIQRDIGDIPMTYDTVNTIKIPAWLPNQYAADQAAVMILGLLAYHKRTGDKNSLKLLDKMAEGVMQMQKGDKDKFPYGAFLSWGNIWHAWGNSQAYALLEAGQKLKNDAYINSGLKEVDHFYSSLLKNGFLSAFWIEKTAEGFEESKREEFARIAYGVRPMVWASVKAYEITGESQYAQKAATLASWFHGNNIAGIKMYDETNGRGYDGIIAPDAINKNAGAESTIESLLVMLRMTQISTK
jgi:hypothetical protein